VSGQRCADLAELSLQIRSLAAFITTTSESRFPVHGTAKAFDMCLHPARERGFVQPMGLRDFRDAGIAGFAGGGHKWASFQSRLIFFVGFIFAGRRPPPKASASNPA
jgi:hypothetical protein